MPKTKVRTTCNPGDLLSPAEAADWVTEVARGMGQPGTSSRTIRRYCADGTIKARRHGKRPWIVPRAEVERVFPIVAASAHPST